jgi:hypothetical protein
MQLIHFGGLGKATRPLEGEGYSAGLWGNQILDFITEVVGFTGALNSLIQQPILAGNAIDHEWLWKLLEFLPLPYGTRLLRTTHYQDFPRVFTCQFSVSHFTL